MWLGAHFLALACCWTWHCPMTHLLPITVLSPRGGKDTGAFGPRCARLFPMRCWRRPASLWVEAWAGTSNPQPTPREACLCPTSLLPASSKGARGQLPAPWGWKGPCSSGSLNPQARPLLSEENYLSWQEERSRDFLEQLAEPALEERLTKNPGSDPFTDAFLFTQ